jgi:galactokinase
MDSKNIEFFKEAFGVEPTYKIVTPSRVNIIGEHSDYFDNFVLSAAIENLNMKAYVKPREDDRIRILSLNLKDNEKPFFEFSTKDDRYKVQWVQYVQGAIAMYAEEYKRRSLKGFDMLIDSSIPVGGGLSSSSALTMTTLASLGVANGFTNGSTDYAPEQGVAIINTKGDDAESQDLLKKLFMMGCWAEYWYGTRGGFNDHLAITAGKKLHATLSDNREKSYQYSPIPEEITFVVCNTGVMHNQLFSEYDNRKKSAFSAINKIEQHHSEVQNARDVTSEMLEKYKDELSELEYKRLRHPITERERVFAFMEALKDKNFTKAGELLNQTHYSLRDDYEVTCDELNIMQELAIGIEGCYGARMVGGGFGGCVIALVDQEKKSDFVSKIVDSYNSHPNILPLNIGSQAWEAVSGDGIKINFIG